MSQNYIPIQVNWDATEEVIRQFIWDKIDVVPVKFRLYYKENPQNCCLIRTIYTFEGLANFVVNLAFAVPLLMHLCGEDLELAFMQLY